MIGLNRSPPGPRAVSTPLSHGLGNVGFHQRMDVKEATPQYLLLQDTPRITDKDPRRDPRPPAEASGDCMPSERKWLSAGKREISPQGYFLHQDQLPIWRPWSPGWGRPPLAGTQACWGTGQLQTD